MKKNTKKQEKHTFNIGNIVHRTMYPSAVPVAIKLLQQELTQTTCKARLKDLIKSYPDFLAK